MDSLFSQSYGFFLTKTVLLTEDPVNTDASSTGLKNNPSDPLASSHAFLAKDTSE